MTIKNPAAFGSRDRKKATAGLKRSSRSGVAGARKKAQNAKKRQAQTGAETFQRLQLLKDSGKRLTKTQEKALQRHEGEFLASHGLDKPTARKAALEHEKRKRVISRILGPSGVAGAVKVSRADGEPFKASDVAAWRKAGWGIEAAGSVPGRVGSGGLPGTVVKAEDWPPYRNPEPLGPGGLARGLVLVGRVDETLLLDLVADGFDVAPAPKRFREALKNPTTGKIISGPEWNKLIKEYGPGNVAQKEDGIWVRPFNENRGHYDLWQLHTPKPRKNPSPANLQKKTYQAIVQAAKKRQALRVDELAERIKAPLAAVADAIQRLGILGMVHEAGRDLFGPCYAPGVPSRGLFDNPTPGRVALKKAAAWYQDENLVDGVKTIRLPHTVEAVEVGKLISITYESDKYDGKKRLWKHDVTGDKTLHISADGKVLVVLPGFQVTKQGIKG